MGSKNGPAAQVVTVAEATGQNDDISALQIVVLVPQLNNGKPQVVFQGVDHVHVAVGTGKSDHSKFHGAKVVIVWNSAQHLLNKKNQHGTNKRPVHGVVPRPL